ncbi:hypothetical protein AHYW_002739 [Providencia manganoxydans]
MYNDLACFLTWFSLLGVILPILIIHSMRNVMKESILIEIGRIALTTLIFLSILLFFYLLDTNTMRFT